MIQSFLSNFVKSISRRWRRGKNASPAFTETRPTVGGRFAFLDAFRGLSALGVVAFHYYIAPELSELPGVFKAIGRCGHLGVPVFFVLSGFVISYSLKNAIITPSFVGRFAARRSLRLDPTYWTAILLALCLTFAGLSKVANHLRGQISWSLLLINMTYINQFTGTQPVLGVGWTLCFEIQFYLVYVTLFGAMQRLTPRIGTEAARLALFGPVAIYSVLIGLGLLSCPIPGLFIERWYLFFLGVVVSWIVEGQLSIRWLIAALLGISVWFLWHFDERALAVAGAGFAAVSITCVARLGHLHDALGWGWLQFLGKISYSLYLIHPSVRSPILHLLAPMAAGLPEPLRCSVLFLGATLGAIAAAYLLYRIVERPSLLLSRRISLHVPPPAEEIKKGDAALFA